MLGEIIAVGEEVLSGDVVNSNAAYLSSSLAEVGIFCRYHTVVGDIEDDIKHQLDLSISRSQVVILSGGLGPTKDDLTKEAVASYLKRGLIMDEDIAHDIESWFIGRNITPTSNNFKQALIIEGSTPLKNDNGTAPGIYVTHKDTHIFLLPGPPNELMPMFEQSVKPYIELFSQDVIETKTFKLLHIGESQAVTIIDDLLESTDTFILAPYAKLNEVHFKATAIGKSREEQQRKIEEISLKLYERLGKYIYTTDDEDLVDVILRLLREKHKTLSLAESCTGGLVTQWFVEKSGASSVIKEGLVTYSNESKIHRLGVKSSTLDTFGAVSKETAYEMALGALDAGQCDYSISITGIAGPEGGTIEKPVGLVYIGIGHGKEIEVFEHRFRGNRDKIRSNSGKTALIHLWDRLVQ